MRIRRSRDCHRLDEAIATEVVRKRGGGTRTLTHLDDLDLDRYEAAVGSVTPAVERTLTDEVIANRARRTPSGLELEPWKRARRRWARSLDAALDGSVRWAFVGDVRDCYGSITPTAVVLALLRVGTPPERIEPVEALLRSFQARGVQGLPIGPSSSAVLANAVLAPVDVAVRDAGEGRGFRWVDDVIVLARDVAGARRAEQAFHRAVDAIGLSANERKCGIVDARDAVPRGATASCISAVRGVA